MSEKPYWYDKVELFREASMESANSRIASRYEVHLDRKLERMLGMLLRLKDIRQGAVAG